MSRFYSGQPITCVWPREKWVVCWPTTFLSPVPILGHRYRAGSYVFRSFLTVEGLPVEFSYSEDGFAPVTEEQVQEIMSAAVLVEKKKTEDA